MYSRGDFPLYFLNAFEKYNGSEKPHISDITETSVKPLSMRDKAYFIRFSLMNSQKQESERGERDNILQPENILLPQA